MKKVGFKSVVSDYLTFFQQPHKNNCGQIRKKRFFLFWLTQTNIYMCLTLANCRCMIGVAIVRPYVVPHDGLSIVLILVLQQNGI